MSENTQGPVGTVWFKTSVVITAGSLGLALLIAVFFWGLYHLDEETPKSTTETFALEILGEPIFKVTHSEKQEVTVPVISPPSSAVDMEPPIRGIHQWNYHHLRTWHEDADGDGFGNPNRRSIFSYTQPEGFVDNNDDCDDSNVLINPNAYEIWDPQGLDEDCNPVTDHDPFTWGAADNQVEMYNEYCRSNDGQPIEACPVFKEGDRDIDTFGHSTRMKDFQHPY